MSHMDLMVTQSLAISLPSDQESDSDSELNMSVSLPASPRTDETVAFMEVFSQPRVAPAVRSLGWRVGPSLDLLTGYNFLNEESRKACVKLVIDLEPRVLMLSPPCTVFSQMQHSNKNRRSDLVLWEQRYEEGKQLWKFACMLFRLQVRLGRHAVIEHPWMATSWSLPISDEMHQLPHVQDFVFDQCLHGLRTAVEGNPVRKRTKLMSNWPLLANDFNTRCTPATCNHTPLTHVWLQGQEGPMSRRRAAQVYPDGMVSSLANAVQVEMLHGQPPLRQLVADEGEESVELPSPMGE